MSTQRERARDLLIALTAFYFIPKVITFARRQYYISYVNPRIAKSKRIQLQQRIDDALRFAMEDGAGGEADATKYPKADPRDCEAMRSYSVAHLLSLMDNAPDAPTLPSGLAPPISAVYILKCFLVNAIEAHKKTNCLVDVCLELALAMALKADAWRAEYPLGKRDGVTLPMLLGVPVSLKENIELTGTDSTFGVHCRCFQPATADAAVVLCLKHHGAVPFVKTNVPQTMLSYECENYIFGTTTNPHNERFTCGGSSGGEGALIACGGSVIGLGSDIGGSVRHPAAFCGIYGLKPGSGRLQLRGNAAPTLGQESVPGVPGPLARTLPDLLHTTRTLMSREGQRLSVDGSLLQTPFSENEYEYGAQKHHARGCKARFAYTLYDGLVGCSPANERAVREIVEKLRSLGHECVEVPQLPHGEELLSIFYKLVSADGTRRLKRCIANERYIPFLRPLVFASNIPPVLKPLVGVVTYFKYKSATFSAMLRSLQALSVPDLYDLVAERNRLRSLFAEFMTEYDALIVPSFTTPPPRLRGTTDSSFGIAFTAPFNVLDVPVVALPVTLVDKQRDEWKKTRSPLGDFLRRRVYDVNAMDGLPVGVQVVVARGREEFALAMAAIVDDSLKTGKSEL